MTLTADAIVMGTAVFGRDGRIGTVAGTRERADHPGYVLVRSSRLFGLRRTTRVVPVDWVAVSERAFRTTLAATRAEVAGCPRLRDDSAIHADVTRKVAAAARAHWSGNVQATVRDGIVRLCGQPADSAAIRWASEAANLVMGVVAVEVA